MFSHAMPPPDDYMLQEIPQDPFGPFVHSTHYTFDGAYTFARTGSASDTTSPSPSLSARSGSLSWHSSAGGSGGAGSPRKMSVSPPLSHLSALPGSPVADAFPLTDDGLPYQPAPLPHPGAPRGAALPGPVRDIPPLRLTARAHPYRRSTTDDHTLRQFALARPLNAN